MLQNTKLYISIHWIYEWACENCVLRHNKGQTSASRDNKLITNGYHFMTYWYTQMPAGCNNHHFLVMPWSPKGEINLPESGSSRLYEPAGVAAAGYMNMLVWQQQVI